MLFVDDQTDLLEPFERTFARDDGIRTASSGEGPLQGLGDHIDIVFFDRWVRTSMVMRIIERLREQDCDTPVVMISAVDREVGRETGCEKVFPMSTGPFQQFSNNARRRS